MAQAEGTLDIRELPLRLDGPKRMFIQWVEGDERDYTRRIEATHLRNRCYVTEIVEMDDVSVKIRGIHAHDRDAEDQVGTVWSTSVFFSEIEVIQYTW